MRELRLVAPAKVNLCLSVAFPPRDGYHAVDSVFQALDLADELLFQELDVAPAGAARTQAGTPVGIECPGLELSVSENLVFRAIDELEAACACVVVPAGHALRVVIDKRIPAGGGLGGGSSNAAAACRAFAQFTGVAEDDPRVLEAAAKLGADVPFFLYGGAALMTGRGDVLVRRLPGFSLPIVLMGDAQGNSTAAVYAAFDAAPPARPDAAALAACMEDAQAQTEELASLVANNLGPAACEANPRLEQRLQQALADADVLTALVTGSGSTCYAVCANDDAAAAFAKRAQGFCDWVFAAHAAPVSAQRQD